MRRMTATVLTAAAIGVGLPSSAIVGAAASTEEAAELPMTAAHASYRRPSLTAQDWVTFADHVIQVRAVSEEEVPPEPIEIERGEGLIGRVVTLDVEQVLWSADDAPRPAPKTYDYPAWGYTFTGGVENRRIMGVQDQPRVEVGHSYVIAIDWEEARCSPGDEPQPAMWMGLGDRSVVPVDNGVIGNGEKGGRVQTAKERMNSVHRSVDDEVSFEGQMTGKNLDAMARELNATRPDPQPADYEVSAQETACD
ncbi:hypothetical protein ACWFMI_04115 [Nocardiopsis terrae]